MRFKGPDPGGCATHPSHPTFLGGESWRQARPHFGCQEGPLPDCKPLLEKNGRRIIGFQPACTNPIEKHCHPLATAASRQPLVACASYLLPTTVPNLLPRPQPNAYPDKLHAFIALALGLPVLLHSRVIVGASLTRPWRFESIRPKQLVEQ